MNKLFVDTNAFTKIGYNFDIKNPIISILIKNAQDRKYEYYNLSVIDNEIISDLRERGEENLKSSKKVKWLKDYINEETIIENCNKDLKDYQNFKSLISPVDCNVSKVDPEIVFKKYFEISFPFEKKADKKNEFPDAFVSEYLCALSKDENEKIYFVTNDNGLIKSLNNDIDVFENLESFLSFINNASPKVLKKIEKFIFENLPQIQSKINQNLNLEYSGLEDEEIDVSNVLIQNITDIDVIENNENSYFINCKCDFLVLQGTFSCLDYYNSYMPNDCDFYAIQEYLKMNEIAVEDYEFMIEIIVDENDNYELKAQEEYILSINYDTLQKCSEDRFEYNPEESFTQDGGLYR